jgi:hypothetical protein
LPAARRMSFRTGRSICGRTTTIEAVDGPTPPKPFPSAKVRVRSTTKGTTRASVGQRTSAVRRSATMTGSAALVHEVISPLHASL